MSPVPSYDSGFPGIAVWNDKAKTNAYIFYRTDEDKFEITMTGYTRIEFQKIDTEAADVPKYEWESYSEQLPSIILNSENLEIINNLIINYTYSYSTGDNKVTFEIKENAGFDLTNAPFIPTINKATNYDSLSVVNETWVQKHIGAPICEGADYYFVAYDHSYPSTFYAFAFMINESYELGDVYICTQTGYRRQWIKMSKIHKNE